MKALTFHFLIFSFLLFLVEGCSPSTEEIRKKEKLEQEANLRLQQEEIMVHEAMEFIKSQSRAIARGEKIAQPNDIKQPDAKNEPSLASTSVENSNRNATNNLTTYTVQVASLNTSNRANSELGIWQQRGFNDAFITRNNNNYRVRLGKYNSKEKAQAQADRVKNEYSIPAWVDIIKEASANQNQVSKVSSGGRFTVQVSAVRSQTSANQEINKWKERGFDEVHSKEAQVSGSVIHRIRIGRYETKDEAKNISSKVIENYKEDAIVAEF
ncbi:MAG: SPOR domain-containing protein [Balneolales bacterium]